MICRAGLAEWLPAALAAHARKLTCSLGESALDIPTGAFLVQCLALTWRTQPQSQPPARHATSAASWARSYATVDLPRQPHATGCATAAPEASATLAEGSRCCKSPARHHEPCSTQTTCCGRASEQELEAVTQDRAQLVPKLEEARWTIRKGDKARDALQADLAAREQV